MVKIPILKCCEKERSCIQCFVSKCVTSKEQNRNITKYASHHKEVNIWPFSYMKDIVLCYATFFLTDVCSVNLQLTQVIYNCI